METTKRTPFIWSRYPSREGVDRVFIASPNTYAEFGDELSKAEFVHMLWVYDKMNDLNDKKKFFRMLFFITLASVPLIMFLISIFRDTSKAMITF